VHVLGGRDEHAAELGVHQLAVVGVLPLKSDENVNVYN
jgi:hypothetical protein